MTTTSLDGGRTTGALTLNLQSCNGCVLAGWGWLDGAYRVSPCYGLPLGPPPPGTDLTPVLSADEIEALVDFLLAKMVGK